MEDRVTVAVPVDGSVGSELGYAPSLGNISCISAITYVTTAHTAVQRSRVAGSSTVMVSPVV